MATLDDLTLIQQFARGDTTLAANQNLRVETAFDTVQLTAKRGGLIASIERNAEAATAIVRHQSEYRSAIHDALLESQFMPTGNGVDGRGFVSYQRCKIPAGYRVNCSEARNLWKEWYMHRRSRSQIDMDMLVLVRKTWYPIRDISYGQEMLIINTLTGDTTVHSTDQMVWLSRLAETSSEQKNFIPPAVTPLSHALRRHATPSNLTAKLAARLDGAPRSYGQAVAPTAQPPGISASPAAQPTTSPTAQPTASPAAQPTTSPAGQSAPGKDPHAKLKQVLQIRDGRLWIKTAVGEVIVEGSNLKFWLNQPKL